jgi:site-specific DNA-methyltransferase (adenine-specific)
MLIEGDCRVGMRQIPEGTIDAIVTDPPYGLEFMGKGWDAPWKSSGDVIADPSSVGGFQDGAGGNPFSRSRIRYGRGNGFQQWFTTVADECFRVLKPGGFIVAFGGTRMFHRLVCAVEDAGFTVQDNAMWVYGSGFPKSHNVYKSLSKEFGEDSEIAQKWNGWGTALKPAQEPILIATKGIPGSLLNGNKVIYCPKVGKAERNIGLDHLDAKKRAGFAGALRAEEDLDPLSRRFLSEPVKNTHPTVKPISLMQDLINLVTSEGETVLDPFLGSGTTAVAAVLSGRKWVGCEMTDEYMPIINGRLAWAEQMKREK